MAVVHVGGGAGEPFAAQFALIRAVGQVGVRLAGRGPFRLGQRDPVFHGLPLRSVEAAGHPDVGGHDLARLQVGVGLEPFVERREIRSRRLH